MLNCIILDFDGVIVDSVDVKTKAYQQIFSLYPDVYEKAMAFHIKNIGLSRNAKFEHLLKNLLRTECTPQKINNLSDMFSEITISKVSSCPYIHGALSFLEHYSKKVPIYIVSSTIQEDIDTIIYKRKLGNYLSGVFGGRPKSETIVNIISTEKLKKYEVVFLGDTIFDYNSAREAGVSFIGIVSGKNPFPVNIPVFSDLQGASNYLKELVDG